MMDSAKRLVMPPVPEEMFLEAVDQVVAANKDWIPPFESGGALYLRPYLFATGPVIGVKPSDEYQFRLFGTPVGSYFKDGIKPITICVSDFDRAAPHGTGDIKAGLNYAMSLHPYILAHEKGFDENMYLDAATRTYVEETGGANFLFVTKDNVIVTPKSDSILPSITRRSLVTLAENLGYKVEHRPVKFTELEEFAEAGLCGTAAVICPVGRVVGKDKTISFPSGMEEMGPVLTKLYNTLRGVQLGTVEAPAGWIREIK
jgi:branched-chain amino acid aminotransferase